MTIAQVSDSNYNIVNLLPPPPHKAENGEVEWNDAENVLHIIEMQGTYSFPNWTKKQNKDGVRKYPKNKCDGLVQLS